MRVKPLRSLRGIALSATTFSLVVAMSACGNDGTVDGPQNNAADATDDSSSSGGSSSGGASSGGSSGGGVCGDGTCGAGESQSNCPLDCKGGGSTGPIGCMEKSCEANLKSCKEEGDCTKWLTCVGGCKTTACIGECTLFAPKITERIQRLANCAKKAECFSGGGNPGKPVCGDGKCEPPENPNTCFADCKNDPTEFCGDGICSNSENPNTCPKDCGKPGPFCGNGKCEAPQESSKNCSKDCKPPVQNPVQCASSKCKAQFGACVANPGCAKVVQCLSQCKDDKCYENCAKSAQNDAATMKVFGPLADCAQKQGCGTKAPQPVCGNGNCEQGENQLNCGKDCKPPSNPVCGDGKCHKPETDKTCAKDCGEPNAGEILKCIQGKCKNQWNNCAKNSACAGVLKCLQGCNDNGNCMEKCIDNVGQKGWQTFMPLMQCGQKSGCIPDDGGKCGDGKCGDGENGKNCPQDCGGTKPGSCANSCGGKSKTGSCFCDKICEKQGDCCGDFKKVCGDGGGKDVCGDGKCTGKENALTCPKDCKTDQKPVCGNGKCEPPFENTKNCAKDCKTDTKPVCGNGKCEKPGEDAITCPKDCTKQGGTCKDKCSGKSGNCWCDKQCVQMGDCCTDYAKYCQGPTVVCGDGKCQGPFENAKNCPKDCKSDTKPVCGNGKCEPPTETAQSCPKDCQTSTVVCGDGKCQAPFENAQNCPKDCQTSTVVCGDGKCQAPFENAANCAKDCKTDGPKKCATIKDCDAGQICCNKGTLGKVCVKAGTCG